MKQLKFIKMHGIGNDFIVIDSRNEAFNLTSQQIIKLCDRNKGIGCDQLVLLESPTQDNADCMVRFFNPDGSESGACGNASRCVAKLVMQEKSVKTLNLQTKATILNCKLTDDNLISVNMGVAKTNWQEIPLSYEVSTQNLGLECGMLKGGFAVNMGNPHAVFFVDNVDNINFDECGSKLENDNIFPQKANIGAVQIISANEINLRVFERGAGETLACGSGACAAVVAAYLSKKTSNNVKVNLKGGSLNIKVNDDLSVVMTGSATHVFDGVLNV